MLAWIHPVAAALVLALLAHVASLGVRARNDRRNRARWLARHAKLAPWMYVAMLLTWGAGLASMWMLRPAEELGQSLHFKLGVALLLTLTLTALSSRWMQHRRVRELHPWLGALALLLSAGQFFYGLPLLP